MSDMSDKVAQTSLLSYADRRRSWLYMFVTNTFVLLSLENDVNTNQFLYHFTVPPTVRVSGLAPVVVDTTVELICTVTAGDLPYSIIWTRELGGEIVFMGNDTTGGNTTIMIGDGDYGTYYCSASNRLGTGTVGVGVVRAST